jgi:UDP-arabinose 4-epimerase
MSTPILVTGGAGYVGSHTCKSLLKAGYYPVTYDNLSRGNASAVRWGPLEIGELHDQKRLSEVMQRYKPLAVLHFAALAYVGESVKNPGIYYWNNVAGTLSLLEVLRFYKIKKFVFSSTCSTYGVPESVPINETHPQKPINPYGVSKLMVEKILADYDQSYGLNSISLRYFNAAGADPDLEIGELHNPETHLIPLLLNAALNEDNVFTLYGSDYPTKDGTCVRDYIHVCDLAEAHVKALRYLLEGGKTSSLNLGTGVGWSVGEIVKLVQAVTGRDIKFSHGPRRLGDPPVLISDPTQAMSVLSWVPQYVGIREQIYHAWRWAQKVQNSILN